MKKILLVLALMLFVQTACMAAANYKYGKTEFYKGRYFAAKNFFLKELSFEPENYECRYFLGQTYYYTNEIDKAKEEYKKILAKSTDSRLRTLAWQSLSNLETPELLKTTKIIKNDNYIEDAKSHGNIVKWAKMPVNVYVAKMENGQYIKKAFLIWQRVTGGLLTFNFVTDKELSQIEVLMKDRIECSNPTAVGCTHYGVIKDNNFQHVRIELAAYTREGDKIHHEEVFTVMLHEIGHAIGIMGHSKNDYDIMSPSINRGVETLSKRDLNTVKLMYGQ